MLFHGGWFENMESTAHGSQHLSRGSILPERASHMRLDVRLHSHMPLETPVHTSKASLGSLITSSPYQLAESTPSSLPQHYDDGSRTQHSARSFRSLY